MGRFGNVHAVAGMAVMPASNGYVTGRTIHVKGGWYMTGTER